MSDLLGDKKVYVGKFREIHQKSIRLGWRFDENLDQRELDDSPFLIFKRDKKIIVTNSLIKFNRTFHDYEEVTPEWILSLPEKVDKSWERLGSQIRGFGVSKDRIVSTSIKKFNPFKESEEFDVYNVLPSREEAEAYRVLPKLLYWRNFYNEDWKPDWSSKDQWKYCIYFYDGKISDTACLTTKHIFAFKSEEIMDKFFKDFKKELEIVKPFL